MNLDESFGEEKTKMGNKNTRIKSKPLTFNTLCGEEWTTANEKYAPMLLKFHQRDCNMCREDIIDVKEFVKNQKPKK